MTEIDSTSLGLTRFRSPTTPSISTSGSAELIELTPRMLIAGVLPGLPEEVVMLRPATEPCNMLVTEWVTRFSSSLLLTVETAPVRLTRFCVP